MIVRLWKTGLKQGRGEVYEEFARDISLPMFRQQKGFLGCIMSRKDDQGLVLTLWRDQDAVDALAHSSTYKATVERMLGADLLTGEQSTEVTDIHLLDLDPVIGAQI